MGRTDGTYRDTFNSIHEERTQNREREPCGNCVQDRWLGRSEGRRGSFLKKLDARMMVEEEEGGGGI